MDECILPNEWFYRCRTSAFPKTAAIDPDPDSDFDCDVYKFQHEINAGYNLQTIT
jgi:hypothetical protein